MARPLRIEYEGAHYHVSQARRTMPDRLASDRALRRRVARIESLLRQRAASHDSNK